MPKEPRVKRLLKSAGFKDIQQENYTVQPDLVDHVLYAGKHHPEKYLDPEIRKGISSFSLISHESEVEIGLEKLRKDLEDRSIDQIIKSYNKDGGDYVFVLAKK